MYAIVRSGGRQEKVAVGDVIEKDQSLIEVETEKAAKKDEKVIHLEDFLEPR